MAIPRWPLGRFIDWVVGFAIRRAETSRAEPLAPEAETDQRVKFRTQLWNGKSHHTIN